MWIFPAAAGVVSAVFGGFVGIQWLRRKRPHHAAWAAALVMFAVASGAAAAGLLLGWNGAWFRTYYLFGAIINVIFLGAGTVYLLGPRLLGHLFAVLCIVAAIFAAGVVISAPLTADALSTNGIPGGSEAWGTPSLPRDLSRYYSYSGFAIVVAGALWSAWRLARHKDESLRPLVSGNVLIAGGTTLVAVAGALARYGQGVPFAIALLSGVVVMFIGFLKIGARPRAMPPDKEDTLELG